MRVSDTTIKKIENVLDEILSKFSTSIYDEQNKQKFNGLIKDLCDTDEDAKEILLTLVVNDVFLFVKEKEFIKVEENTRSCLTSIGCELYVINKVLEILKIADSLKKIKRKKQLKKLRNWAIVLIVLAIPVVAYIFDYNSYYRTDSDVFIQGGEFSIGKNIFSVDNFFISKTEITISQYSRTMSDKPITNVSWYDAIKYCNELSKKTNLDCVYKIDSETGAVSADFSKNGYRLPTKAEWYRAAKGSSKTSIDKYAGAKENDSFSISDYCWFIENSEEQLHDVAKKKQTSNYLYDMSGNAAEWCWDYYWDWNDKIDDGVIKNPKGPEEGTYRSLCGGFYGNSKKYMNLINSQSKHKPDSGEIYCGFRVARSYVKMNKEGAK